jgi:hypothetical protein
MGDDFDLEIDLTAADTGGGLLPIRWVCAASNGDASRAWGGSDGPRTNGGHIRTTAIELVPPPPRSPLGPHFVTLAPLIPSASPAPPPPVITRGAAVPPHEPRVPITLRRVMASRGARFLTVVVVAVFAALVAGNVLLWQRVEDSRVPAAPAEPAVPAVTPADLRGLQERINRVETLASVTLDPTGTTVTSSPSALQSDLDSLRYCLVAFQQAITSQRPGFIHLC